MTRAKRMLTSTAAYLRALGMLNRVWHSSHISINTKLKLFNSNVKSVLQYGCESWSATDSMRRKLQVFVNKCLRKIHSIFWQDRITNVELLGRARQHSLKYDIAFRKWNWIGYTLRKPRQDMTRLIFMWPPPGKKSRGRPQLTCRKQT